VPALTANRTIRKMTTNVMSTDDSIS
jgi:hypothetical protein